MRHFMIILIITLLCGITATTRAQTRMERGVLAGGGVQAGNGTRSIVGTIGQTIIGTAKNTNQQGSFGFWYGKANISTAVERIASSLPASAMLGQNYPNPAGDVTTIRFSLPSAEHIRLIVTDAFGRVVAIVADGMLGPGSYQSDLQVMRIPAGNYFVQLYAGPSHLTRRLVVLH